MRVYSSDLATFERKLITNELFRELEAAYPTTVGRSVSSSEAHSWRASLPRLEAVLRLANLPKDVWITIEERIPYYAKRIDVALFGYDEAGVAQMVIIELKAWTTAKALANGNVQTLMGSGLVSLPHPSAQVGAYQEHLGDFCRALQGDNAIALSSCVYCHNYSPSKTVEGLFDARFDDDLQKSPLFGENDAIQLGEFLHQRLAGGKGKEVIGVFDAAGLGPSKQLVEHANAMIQKQNVFRLLDEQLAANNSILRAIGQAITSAKKQVILVRGGPGTGKSIIALNALGEVLRKELQTYLVTGSAAFTHSMRQLLGRNLAGLVRFTDFFWNFEPNSVDVLIIDEAHRIRDKSEPRVSREKRPQISQVEELIKAAKVVVFFVDENQIISPKEAGEPRLIEETAKRLGAHFEEYQLMSQFRCNGSDTYLDWLDDVLALAPKDQGFKLATPEGFNFKIVDTPEELLFEIQSLNKQSPNSARLIAGWCWPWSDPNTDGSLVEDIVIGDFRFPWEAKNGSKPAAGIPEAKLWAIEPAGVNQAGCVYSVQGFEAKHVGVIIGLDLVRRNGQWIAQPQNNYSNDLRRKDPKAALPYIKRIYRTLLSRGMHSCSVFCIDEETRCYIESRLLHEGPNV